MSDFVNKLSEIEAEQKEIRERAVNIERVVNSLEGVQVSVKSDETQAQPPEKSATQLKKEAKNKEKDEKFKAKLEKQAAAAAAAKEKTAASATTAAAGAPAKPAKAEEKKQEVKTYTSNTKPGERKDTTCPLPDAYSPGYVEAAWYEWWEKMGFFKPEAAEIYFKNTTQPREKFVMAMPPPNVTGSLHLGHALMCAIEDTLTRWHRMLGHETLWCPGFDHAGIATQVVVEKKIKREQNKTRHDLGREAFVQEIWKWKNEKGDTIANQLKRIGSSCDWDRQRFTMDDVSVKAVLEAFIRMHEKGLIYRNKRLVNWSCALNSAISDIEVDKVALKGKTYLSIPGYAEKLEFGTLTSFAYKVIESETSGKETGEEIVVATTRVETMLGDTGIVVHPDDKRYTHLVGKYVVHPFIPSRKIRILADTMVDMSFGTGAVKVTPAHDANDFEVGKRLNLQFITIIDDKGLITSEGGVKFAGMKRFDARKAVLKELKEMGLFRGVAETESVLPMCSRSKDIIEPLLKSQWYVNCKEMSERAVRAVREKKIKIVPDFHETTWFHWMEDCHDWCISRQLWWGHRIPAYFVKLEGEQNADDTDNNYWVSAQSHDEAMKKAQARFPNKKIAELYHDEDVLDTWFSSGIFPFSICGWPEKTPDMSKFYPGNLLETGHDILFFWVARMVMMGEELTGQLPFDTVFLHAIIRDAHGRKMSKSLGNIIDPLDVINGTTLDDLNKQLQLYNLDPKEVEKAVKGQKEDFPNGIPECGTDALRFALCAYTAQGRDINLDVLRIQGYRHFCNKLWNATKFAMINGGLASADFKPAATVGYLKENLKALRGMDTWILSRLSECVELCEQGLKNYELTTATTALFNFWLYDLCDYYIEYLKPSFYALDQTDEQRKEFNNSREVLYTCLDVGLRLISPFMPFISEELYQRLPRRCPKTDAPSICVTPYPLRDDYHSFRHVELEAQVKVSQEAISKLRSLRADYQLTPKTKVDIYVQSFDQALQQALERFKDLMIIMTNGNGITFLAEKESPPVGCVFSTLSDKCKVFILLKGIIDIDKEEAKLGKKKEGLLKQIETMKKDMALPNYETRVPEGVRQKNQEKLVQLANEVQLIEDGVKQLQAMRS